MIDIEERLFYTTRSIRNSLILIMSVGLVYILKALSTLILPLVLALLLTLIVLPLVLRLKEKGWPIGVIVPLISLVTLAVISSIVSIFVNAFSEMLGQQDQLFLQLDKKLDAVLYIFNTKYSMNTTGEEAFQWLFGEVDMIRISSMIKAAASGVGSFGRSFFLFMLYFIFLLGGSSSYREYVDFVAKNDHRLTNTVSSVQSSISTYMVIKSSISLGTAILVFLICTIMGIKFAFLWSVLTFFLNFVPSIGSIIATVPPLLMAFVQYDTYTPLVLTFLLLTVTQVIIGNFVEPMIMGDRLRINTVSVIFGLVFWGYVWGIPGTLLSVPMMVSVKLMFEQSESFHILARVMGYPDKVAHEKIKKKGRKDDSRPTV